MQWIIQQTGLPDSQTTKLLEALKQRNLPFVPIEHVPFSHEIINLGNIEVSKPGFFYGSVQLTQQFHDIGLSNYVMYDSEWFHPTFWAEKRPDLLNAEQTLIRTEWLRSRWTSTPIFIKPLDPVKFKGQVIEPDKEDHDNWLIEHSHLHGNDYIVASPIQQIEKEWRFFVFDHEVVTGSLYKRDGYLCIREPVPSDVWYIAEEAANLWLPNKDVVMDIALLRSGEYKVIEFNCVNSSGFYNCDVGKVVGLLEERNG